MYVCNHAVLDKFKWRTYMFKKSVRPSQELVGVV